MDYSTTIIHWKGPFSFDEIGTDHEGNGLYLFSGKRRWQRDAPYIQYFGITERGFKQRLKEHHKLPKVHKDLQIWIGTVAYPLEKHRKSLEMAESLLVYYWQPTLNERKKVHRPRPGSVISHWFKKNGEPRIRQLNITKELPDVICWDGKHWRAGNLSVYADA